MEILCLMILAGTCVGLVRFAARFGPGPGYDWPVLVYRVQLWRAARRHPAPVIYYRAALGRIPGETEQAWATRRDTQIG
jgi:hypothetical protein